MYDVCVLNYLGFFKVEWCLGVGENLRKQKRIYFFRSEVQFSEKLGYTLIYCANRLHSSQNYSKWSIIDDDPDFGDFLGPKFPSFHMEGSGRKYFGKTIVRAFKYRTCKGFSYLFVFLVFWKLIFVRVRQMIFRDLGVMTSRSFCYRGIVLMLLDLNWFVIPAIFACYLRYPVSCIYFTLLNWHEFQRLSRCGDRTSWIRHGTYVINQFTFCWKNLCCWAVYLLIRD